MPIELLAVWGVTAAFSAVLKPILVDLAKESAADFGKDFCSGALESVLLGRDPWKKAVGRAVKEFLEQFEQELIGAGVGDFLDFYLRACDAPWRLDPLRLRQELAAGRVRVFFVVLDEVFDPGLREEVVTSIVRFSNEYPRARIIVTSRVIGYKGESLRHAEFRHFMLQELDEGQVACFLEKWHGDTYRPIEARERDEKHARLT